MVRFADANTVVRPQFMDRLFDRIAQEGINKEYVMDLRADTVCVNPALVKKMAKGGLKVVITGFESFRNEELTRYRKSTKESSIRDAVRIMHENGIMVRGNYVVPPDYGPEDFAGLAGYAASHAVPFAGYTILTPLPGTALFEQMRDQIIDCDYSKYNFFNCVLKTRLPLREFYESVGNLWPVRKGEDVI